MNGINYYQFYTPVQAAHFCEISIVGYRRNMIGGSIRYDNSYQIVFVRVYIVGNIKSESRIPSAVLSCKPAVDIDFRNSICTFKFQIEFFSAAFFKTQRKVSAVAYSSTVVVSSVGNCHSACTVFRIICMRQYNRLP